MTNDTERIMTPDEFAKQMGEIFETFGWDIEAAHSKADTLMCQLLQSLGYDKGVEIFDGADRWYA